ncbi:hypothetical protein F5Y15DRAFT_322780 [Xylariaceae sp. FL0016]|nr:hypothetical protein F5Y15DRAFT_322780 [Xylariaceae sp. FL0016]
MHSTFTGASRRPRNVNLSGQANTNPWASSGWGSASSGASKTVAQAQAEREKRQRERNELASTKRIQRAWRGHRARRQVQADFRQEFDALCQTALAAAQPSQPRITKALSLLLALFDPAHPDDQRRLDVFVQELLGVGDGASSLPPVDTLQSRSWCRLVPLLVGALENRRPASSSFVLVRLLVHFGRIQPGSLLPVSDRYYTLLAGYSRETRHMTNGSEQHQILTDAVIAPLHSASDDVSSLRIYQAFAYSFLTSPDLSFVECNAASITESIDLQLLSWSIARTFQTPDILSKVPKDALLFLLAHYIALNRAVSTLQGSSYLEALYLQLSWLAVDIRHRFNTPEVMNNNGLYRQDDEDDGAHIKNSLPLPEYVVSQLDFLVNEDGIMELLSRFISTASFSARSSEDASLLAGYTLVLLRCFPSYGDDIKMRLFQGDISIADHGQTNSVPSVKFFWRAASRTSIFTSIKQPDAQKKPMSVVALLKQDSVRDLEWRTVLLFLELYNFLLRVTDDEDFLPSEAQILSEQSPATARIRSSGLNLDELKALIHFLKNLSFPLYYNLPEIMPRAAQPGRLNALMGVGLSSSNAQEKLEDAAPSFAGIIGMDVLGLRDALVTTMRSLYERDSRRAFLPKGFWLMTSKFDMDGFISAVVLEEARKDELAEEEDDEDEDDVIALDGFHTSAGHRLSRAAQIERHRQLRKIQREQLLGQIGPKLEILRNMPFAIPFEVRVQIFRQFVYLDKVKRRNGHVDADRWRLAVISGEGFDGTGARGRDILGRHTAQVQRGQVFDDAYEHFFPLGEGLKEPIQITFVDQFGTQEAGIDGGGVTKEFLISVTNEAFTPGPDGHGFFAANSQNLLYPNPSAFDNQAELLRLHGCKEGSTEWRDEMADLAKRYEFLGRIVGKCMYEGILIDISFAGFFLLKWSSSGQSMATAYRASLNDLRDLDPELYQGLISLKNYPGDVTDLSLDFTITDQFVTPQNEVRTITHPLRKDGENIPVTNKDRPLYISYVANHRLVAQQYKQTQAFLRGLGSMISPSWLSMFNQSELQRLVGGDSSEINVEDLRRNTMYSGLYVIGDDGEEHPTIQLFWQVMRKLQDSERRDVLKYVTSTPRAPLLGFSQLNPPFSIRDGGTDEARLPSTSTCVNLLKLPRYTDAKTLREKLLYAVQSGAGFDLS